MKLLKFLVLLGLNLAGIITAMERPLSSKQREQLRQALRHTLEAEKPVSVELPEETTSAVSLYVNIIMGMKAVCEARLEDNTGKMVNALDALALQINDVPEEQWFGPLEEVFGIEQETFILLIEALESMQKLEEGTKAVRLALAVNDHQKIAYHFVVVCKTLCTEGLGELLDSWLFYLMDVPASVE